MTLAPAIFVSHGSPMFALEPGRLGPALADIGRSLAGIRGVLVVSPHWMTRGLRVSTTATPETIHDFGGFPSALYQLQYPAPGAPDIARQALAVLAAAGLDAHADDRRGLDHGAWVPLRHLRPLADWPVFQVSLPHDYDARRAYALGRALAPLRAQGVLIVGSGSMTHNLREYGLYRSDPGYVQVFVDWVRAAVAAGDVEALLDYRQRAPGAVRAHPTEDHFLPLLVALGAAADAEALAWIYGGITDGILSMDAFAFGLTEPAAAVA